MKTKSKTLKVNITNGDPRLADLLADYEYTEHETRNRSRGKDSLYIRLTRIQPSIRLTVA